MFCLLWLGKRDLQILTHSEPQKIGIILVFVISVSGMGFSAGGSVVPEVT